MTPAAVALALLGLHPPAPKEPPQLGAVRPLAAEPGKATKLLLRGKRLDRLTGADAGGAPVRLLGPPKKAADKGADKLGDQEVEVELTLPADAAGELALTLANAVGQSKPLRLAVADRTPRVAEAEPNDGFAAAQRLPLPVVVEGAIGRPKDVDVFRFDGRKGQTLSAAVHAARHGSPLDAVLTLYDADRRAVEQADDGKENLDPTLSVTLPADGVYYLAVADAHDAGSAWHTYRMTIQVGTNRPGFEPGGVRAR